MKLRLIGGGFENYTGQMGVIQFVDGLSEGDVLVVDAIRVAGVIGAEWEDGTPANVSQFYLDGMNTAAVTETVANNVVPAEVVVKEPGSIYTEEQLTAIAAEQGIAGLRTIGDTLGVKGNSIVGLIESILVAQKG